MNIWISSRRIALFAGFAMLSACLATPEGKAPGTGPRLGLTRTAPETVTVAKGAIVIGGPRGFCVDKTGSRLRGNTAFVLLASCYSITQNPEAKAPFDPAILTASVAEPTGAAPTTEAALDQLMRFLETEQGRATLAGDGQAGSVEILESRRDKGAVLVRLRDLSTNPTQGLEQTYWRGFFDLNGRLITTSALGFEARPLSGESGLALLREFLARIRYETKLAGGGVAAEKPPVLPKRLFGGLFN